MNRAERRKYAKRINTPKKLENFSDELERRIRYEYEQKSRKRENDFVKSYSILLTYVLDYELEKAENIRVTARKTKDMTPKISRAVRIVTESILEHLQLLEKGEISIEDIEKYLKEERNIEWKW